MQRDARFALFHQNQQFQIAVQEYQLHVPDAVSQDVEESSERCEGIMIQDNSCCPNSI